MRKLLNRPWFVVLLALVALYGVWDFAFSHSSTPSGPTLADAPTEHATGEDAEAAPTGAGLPPELALKSLPPAANLRDIFAPFPKRETPEPNDATSTTTVAAAGPVETVERFRVTALWTQNSVTLVLLNGRICQAGDVVGRCRIESASIDGIWLRHSAGREFLAPGREFVLRSSSSSVAPVETSSFIP